MDRGYYAAGQPHPARSFLPQLGAGHDPLSGEIAEQVRRSLNLSLTGAQIENVLRGSPDSMDDRVKAIIQREAGLYARRILSAIAEAGLDCRAMPVVFLGGGAGLMKRYLPQGSVLRPVILDDDKLNAQAYERLAGQVADHAG